MSGKRYTDEFKSEAAKQVIEHGRSVREVSSRLGVSVDLLYARVREQRSRRKRSRRTTPRRQRCAGYSPSSSR